MKKHFKKHGKKLMLGIILLAVMAAGAFYWMNRSVEEPPMVQVERETLEELAEEIGEIVTEDYRQVVAHLPGRIGQLNVEPGDQVLAGDMLVEIDSSDWRTSVNQVDEQLRAARSKYQQAMDSGRRQQQQAQSALEVALSQWEEVQERKERITALHEAGAVSQQELKVVQLEESLAAAGVEQAELALAAAGDALSPASRGSFEANIRQLESQREHLMTQQDSYLVTAPVSGTILHRHVEPGAFVQPGQMLMEMGDLNKLYVKADLLAREMAGVEEGMAVRVIHRDLGTDPARGTIRKVYPTAFSKVSELGIEQRRVQIEIEVEQIDPLWRPGYEVDVEVIKDTRENTLTVPERAVFWTNGKEHLFVWENDQAVLREVTTGLTAQNRIEILSGIDEGDYVLTEPENQ